MLCYVCPILCNEDLMVEWLEQGRWQGRKEGKGLGVRIRVPREGSNHQIPHFTKNYFKDKHSSLSFDEKT